MNTSTLVRVLNALYELNAPASAGQIARQAGMSKQGILGTLKFLKSVDALSVIRTPLIDTDKKFYEKRVLYEVRDSFDYSDGLVYVKMGRNGHVR